MNIRYKILLLIFSVPVYCAACPCCVGAIDEDSEPFFSDDCYKDKQPPAQQQPQPQPSDRGVNHE